METQQTPLRKVIVNYEQRFCSIFKPAKPFYEKVGINHKRFALLVRGKLPLQSHELKTLSDFFQVPITDLF